MRRDDGRAPFAVETPVRADRTHGGAPGTHARAERTPVRAAGMHAPATGALARGAGAFALVAGALFLAPEGAHAQSVRGWVGTSVQMVELRPMALDTVPPDRLDVDEHGRRFLEGEEVACATPDLCTRFVPLSQDETVSLTQDVSLTAWGFGVQGLSATTLLRARARRGGDVVWPRSDDEFDALLGYVQLVRGRFRVRGGRQEVRTGLGFPAFDGGSVVVTGRRGLSLEAYGGRSLARGLREPANEALRGLESFLADTDAYLLGGAVGGRLLDVSLAARYHREVLGDGSGLVTERASLDFTRVFPHVRLGGSLDYDFAFGKVGKANLDAVVPLAGGRWLVEGTLRRYLPYFELSTIWGFFQPVAYTELEAKVGWSPSRELGVWASGGWREYGDAEATEVFQPLDDHGWRANAGFRWTFAPAWTVDGAYRVEWGPGAFLNSGDASVRYAATDRLGVSASTITFQQIEEFRVGDGRAIGGGLSLDWSLFERTRLSGGWSVIRHHGGGSPFTSPWNQGRAWTSVRVDVGSDPGLARRGGL